MPEDRSQRGAKLLKAIHGQWGAPQVLGPLQKIAPDLVAMIRDFAFGEIYARPGLDLKSRQLVTLSALAAQGAHSLEFKAHVHGALTLGWTKEQIVEALMQIALYAGFPAAIHALLLAQETFNERDARENKKGNSKRR
jgi:4-carboxymuconolactone decarboxylase